MSLALLITITTLITSAISLKCDNNQYKSIDSHATDEWCMNNCNSNPPYCPDDHCACGLSYLLPFTMGNRRHLQEEPDDDLLVEPCYGWLDDIETACSSVLEEEYSECCAIRTALCEDSIKPNCKWDSCSCVMNEGYDINNKNNIINECVSNTLSAAMHALCVSPVDNDNQNNANQ
eukprot:245092_1